MERLFGTDGVRGVANVDLTPELAVSLGRAAGEVIGGRGTIVVGRDSRVSGPMLEGALVAGLCSAGIDVLLVGVMPTPGVSFLTHDEGARGGAVISASHNPVEDNGIKFFAPDGSKLEVELEREIEERLGAPETERSTRVGSAHAMGAASDRYIDHLLKSIDEPLAGLRLVVDCAWGAAWQLGPRAFREAGADVTALHAEPDGARINVDCGSTNLGPLKDAVVKEGADLGIAFDGDADRALAVDEAGREVDGDRILGMVALHLKEEGRLKNDVVVSTVMSNLGFRRALEAQGIEVECAAVGDRYVAELMKARSAAIGGEQSGHLIFSEHSPTGDGILTGLQLMEVVVSSSRGLSDLVGFYKPFPQVLINVRAKTKGGLAGDEEIAAAVRTAEEGLGDSGRVLVRPSGTEPLVRVMVEAEDAHTAERTARSIAEVVARRLG